MAIGLTDQLKEIGIRLSALREICDITTEEMAKKMDIPHELYLAYEDGKEDFSFSFLYNAAGILQVDVLDIMSGDSPKLSTCAVVKKGQGYSITRNQAYSYKHLAYTFRKKKAEPFLVTVEPCDTIPTLHEHEGQEFDYVVSGKICYYLGEVSYELEAGDSIYFDSKVPHAIKSLNNQPAQFLAVVMK